MNAWLAALVKKLIELLLGDLWSFLKEQWAKVKRSQDQASGASAVAHDQGKPRDPTVKADELKDIND